MKVPNPLRAFVIVGSAFAGGLLGGAGVVREAVAGVWADYAGLDTLARAITTIDRRYVEDIEADELAHAAVQGMTDALDQYSTYHSPKEWRALAEAVEGAGAGIGLDLERMGTRVRVARIVPEAPADLAGLQVGMFIESVDAAAVQTVSEAESRLQGPLGQPVQLSGTTAAGTPFDLAVVRDSYEDIRVGGGPLPGALHYIRIGRFTRGTGLRFNQHTARIPPETRGLVLDLRGNPGGLLSEAGAVADRFLTDGLVVETVARDETIDGSITATAQVDDLELPVAILIDRNSASAAEVLAGALSAHGRAILVGSNSYGKGSVQSIVEFEDGGALRLTTAAYRLSDGRTIDRAHPLTPDIRVSDIGQSSARSRLTEALASHAPDDQTRAAWLADLASLGDPAVNPEAPAPIPLGADPADYVGRDPTLDASMAHLGTP